MRTYKFQNSTRKSLFAILEQKQNAFIAPFFFASSPHKFCLVSHIILNVLAQCIDPCFKCVCWGYPLNDLIRTNYSHSLVKYFLTKYRLVSILFFTSSLNFVDIFKTWLLHSINDDVCENRKMFYFFSSFIISLMKTYWVFKNARRNCS